MNNLQTPYTSPLQLPTIGVYNLNRVPHLIRFALEALEAFESTPGCEVDMSRWHSKRSSDGVCLACLAGCATTRMAGVGVDDPFWASPDPFWGDADDTNKTFALSRRIGLTQGAVTGIEKALDLFRCGRVGQALRTLWLPDDKFDGDRIHMPDYHRDPARFKARLLELADQLESKGF